MHRDTRRPPRPRDDPCRSCGCPIQGDLGAYCEACEADQWDAFFCDPATVAEASRYDGPVDTSVAALGF